MTFLLHTWLQALSRKSARRARTRRGANRHRPHRVVLRLEALEELSLRPNSLRFRC